MQKSSNMLYESLFLAHSSQKVTFCNLLSVGYWYLSIQDYTPEYYRGVCGKRKYSSEKILRLWVKSTKPTILEIWQMYRIFMGGLWDDMRLKRGSWQHKHLSPDDLQPTMKSGIQFPTKYCSYLDSKFLSYFCHLLDIYVII